MEFLRNPESDRPVMKSRRGAILLLILVMIVVMGAILTQFTEKGLSEIAGEGYYVERDRLRITAYGALETTLAVLADFIAIEETLQAPAQGWGDPIAYAGVDFGDNLQITVSFTDHTSRLPLNSLDEGTLYLLFDEMGIEPDDSLLLTNCLLDWIDEDDETRIDGAESDEYSFRDMPHRAANRPIRKMEELAVIEGFDLYFFDDDGRPNTLYETFAEMVSPYGAGRLNVNSATWLTLRAAGGMGDPQLDAITDYMAGADRTPGTGDDRYFSSTDELLEVIVEMPPDINLGVNVSVLAIEIQVTEGNAVFDLNAIISLDGTGVAQVATSTGRQASSDATSSTTENSASASVDYPFVFLELTEDVTHNDLRQPSPADEEDESET